MRPAHDPPRDVRRRERPDVERLDREALDRVDAGLLLGQPVGRERERQQQGDPRRPAVVDGEDHDRDEGQPDGVPLQPAQPLAWASRAVSAYRMFGADCIVAEVNQGGEMVKIVIGQVE